MTINIELTSTGYSAFAEDLGIYTTGRSIIELQNNCREAIELALGDSHPYRLEDEIRFKLIN